MGLQTPIHIEDDLPMMHPSDADLVFVSAENETEDSVTVIVDYLDSPLEEPMEFVLDGSETAAQELLEVLFNMVVVVEDTVSVLQLVSWGLVDLASSCDVLTIETLAWPFAKDGLIIDTSLDSVLALMDYPADDVRVACLRNGYAFLMEKMDD